MQSTPPLIDREVEKLAAYLGERNTITVADVENVTTRSPEDRVFPLIDAVAAGILGLDHFAELGFGQVELLLPGLSILRRKIALKMQDAKRRIPHFSYVEECDVTELEALRAAPNAQHAEPRGRLTLLPFLMRAIARTTPEFPEINARYDDENAALTRYGAVHIGIATQTDGGLVVPVVRHAEARDLWSCAAEVARLAEAARAGKATRDELSGSTITITESRRERVGASKER